MYLPLAGCAGSALLAAAGSVCACVCMCTRVLVCVCFPNPVGVCIKRHGRKTIVSGGNSPQERV